MCHYNKNMLQDVTVCICSILLSNLPAFAPIYRQIPPKSTHAYLTQESVTGAVVTVAYGLPTPISKPGCYLGNSQRKNDVATSTENIVGMTRKETR
jgi:hypothetical protein